METGLTVDIDDREFEGRLRNIYQQLQAGAQSRGLMRAIGYYMRRRTLKHFADEEDPWGEAWEPLAESTLARPLVKDKRKRGNRKILHGRTGDLRGKIQSLSDETSAEIGTNIFYGIFHQEGAPRARIPVRAFLGVADEDAEGIYDLAWAYLVRAMNG